MTLSKVQLAERLSQCGQATEIRRLRHAEKGTPLYKKFYYEDCSLEETLLSIANVPYVIKAIGNFYCYLKA